VGKLMPTFTHLRYFKRENQKESPARSKNGNLVFKRWDLSEELKGSIGRQKIFNLSDYMKRVLRD